ncbi:MAG TPA: hypothetical protein VI729_09660 [Anaerolineales bacterium]|nr:MAG: hypothetical protein A2Z37_09000 [Chloroflexi bacterium RBG_19FT_COMBO_62_14]HLE04858.1 hypothetical protein [Anaerolineales bacterium]
MEPHEEAIAIFREVIRDLTSGNRDLISIMRRCQHACEIMGWQAGKEWFHQELNGYYPNTPLPLNRRIQGTKKWKFEGSTYETIEYQTEEAMDGLDSAVYDEEAETLDVKAGVAWFITGSKIGYNEDLQETKKAPSPSRSTTVTLRRVRSFQPGTISYALSQIEKNVFDWVSSAYAQLAYGNRVKNIWESYRTRVDNTLQNLGLASHLSAIQDDIAKDNPESWRSAVLECRNLLNDLANHLWQDQRETYGPLPGDGPGGKLDVRQGKYANRLSAFLHRKTVTGSEGKFLRDEAERLSASIRSLIELQSSAHEPIARPLAESVVLSTYFMIGELASKTDLAPITDSASSAA